MTTSRRIGCGADQSVGLQLGPRPFATVLLQPLELLWPAGASDFCEPGSAAGRDRYELIDPHCAGVPAAPCLRSGFKCDLQAQACAVFRPAAPGHGCRSANQEFHRCAGHGHQDSRQISNIEIGPGELALASASFAEFTQRLAFAP